MSKVPVVKSEIPKFITAKQVEIAALCRQFDVVRLEVFGSVMTDEFDPERSDIDFVIRFASRDGFSEWMTRRLGLQDGLTNLLGHEADLVESETGTFSDPFFRRWADPTRRVIFDALQDREVAERHPEAVPSPR